MILTLLIVPPFGTKAVSLTPIHDAPAIECADGAKYWLQHDKLHRENGPAIEYANGGVKWYQHDKLHREDGPAIEWADGSKEYWIRGEKLTQEEFLSRRA